MRTQIWIHKLDNSIESFGDIKEYIAYKTLMLSIWNWIQRYDIMGW